MNTNGLCVVKKLVQYTTIEERKQKLMAKLSENVIELVQNPFGNYAVTEVLNNWDYETCRPIFIKIQNKISQLSIQKFSSNVIERCLEKADEGIRSLYIEEICNSERLSSKIYLLFYCFRSDQEFLRELCSPKSIEDSCRQ